MKNLGVILLATLSLGVSSAQSNRPEILGETNPFAALAGNRFHGTWTGVALGPTPQVVTLERSGTFVWQSAFQAGGYSLSGSTFTMIQGNWRRTGPRSMELLGIRYVFSADKKLLSAERAIVTMAFGDDFDTLEGEASLEEVLCQDVPAPPPFNELPSCPDIGTAPADVVRGPFAISLKRLKFGGGGS